MPRPVGSGRPSFISETLAIAAGGAIGACLRFGISLLVTAEGWPGAFGTGVANVLGSFLLGLLAGHVESDHAHPLLRPFLTVGAFGSFTTFSAFAADNRAIAGEAGELEALLQLAATLSLGLAAFALGTILDARLERGGRR
jgi:CrcB protein